MMMMIIIIMIMMMMMMRNWSIMLNFLPNLVVRRFLDCI